MASSISVLLLVPLFISSLFFASRFLSTFSSPFTGSLNRDDLQISNHSYKDSVCSKMANNAICCDRSNYHSDICFMKGDVRTQASSSSIFLFSSSSSSSSNQESVRPYTRKWEVPAMNKIPQLHLGFADPKNDSSLQCDIRHNVTALFFSIGGYTGNIFHAFNNDLVPLYITSQHLNRKVVFVVLRYQYWWHSKYREILSQLSDFPLVDFFNDTRTHCFPEAIVGLRFHKTLDIDPSQMEGNKTMMDFHHILNEAYKHVWSQAYCENGSKKKLVIMARNGTRSIENEQEVVELAKEIGFDVEILRPNNTMQLSEIYKILSGCDVMMGVHGAALTHYLLMRPGSLFIQIVPIGLDELARLCFGEAAAKIGIEYEEYRIDAMESSLYRRYGGDDPVVRDLERFKAKGWEFMKDVYLEGQNVTLDVHRLKEHLMRALERN